MKDHLNEPHAIFLVRADWNLLKSVWECSELKVSRWKILHPSNTEDECAVGLTSEDETEGLEPTPEINSLKYVQSKKSWFGLTGFKTYFEHWVCLFGT